MNKEEIKFDHFKDIEELIKHLEMWYAEDDYFAYERYFHLRDARIMGMFIYELQQENKQLKEIEKEHQRINGELREELQKANDTLDTHNELINHLQEVIDEVREYVNNHMYYTLSDGNTSDYVIEKAEEELLQILDKGERK